MRLRELQKLLLVSVVVSLSSLFLQADAQTTAVISPDGTVQAELDATTNTTFNCVVREAGILTWIVDRMAAQDQRIRNRGIIMAEVSTMVNGDLEGSITVPNSAVNNQTTLICVAKNVHPPEVNSSEVVLELLATQEASTDSTISDSSLETTTITPSSAASLTRLNTVIISMIALCVTIALWSGNH